MTIPVLTLPDPKLQFVVEVDASVVGLGAFLSQKSVADSCLHPCAFLSRKLSSAKRNYNIWNFWPLRQPWRSGDTGWRGQSFRF